MQVRSTSKYQQSSTHLVSNDAEAILSFAKRRKEVNMFLSHVAKTLQDASLSPLLSIDEADSDAYLSSIPASSGEVTMRGRAKRQKASGGKWWKRLRFNRRAKWSPTYLALWNDSVLMSFKDAAAYDEWSSSPIATLGGSMWRKDLENIIAVREIESDENGHRVLELIAFDGTVTTLAIPLMPTKVLRLMHG